MGKKIDIIDVMIAVNNGKLKVFVKNGFFMLEDTQSGECVRLNEVRNEDINEVIKTKWVRERR